MITQESYVKIKASSGPIAETVPEEDRPTQIL